MRIRTLLVLCAALALTVGVTAAMATSTKKDQLTGNGVRTPSCDVGCPSVTFSFDTWSSPTGVNPTGTLRFDMPGLATFTGHPTCMNVNGHTATIVGVMDTASGEDDAVGGYFLVTVSDNGKTKNGVSPDRMSLVAWGTSAADAFGSYAPAEACADSSLVVGTQLLSLRSGNINVTDAS